MAGLLLLVVRPLNDQEADRCLFPFFLVCKEPPYKVEESGYAGFIMPIEVHFKNKVGSRKWQQEACTVHKRGSRISDTALRECGVIVSGDVHARVLVLKGFCFSSGRWGLGKWAPMAGGSASGCDLSGIT